MMQVPRSLLNSRFAFRTTNLEFGIVVMLCMMIYPTVKKCEFFHYIPITWS